MNPSPVTPDHRVLSSSPACPVRQVKRSRGFDLEEDADLARRIHRARTIAIVCDSAARVGVKMKLIGERIELARQQIETYQSEIIMLETELDDLRSQ